MTLDLYFARRFLGSFLRVLAVFFGILLLIDLIEQIRRFSGQDISLNNALVMALLNVPQSLYQILPLLMILTGIMLFLNLAKSSELVVVRSFGRSGLRFLAAPVLTALAIGAFGVTVLNPLVSATTKEYKSRAAALKAGSETEILSVSAEGLWLRQGDSDGQTVIRAARISPEGLSLGHVSFHLFSSDGALIGRIEAETVSLAPGEWQLEKAKRWDLTMANPEASAQTIETGLTLPTDLTPQRLIEGVGSSGPTAFWNLQSQANALERAGFSARAYRLAYQMELALPLLLAAMVLLAAGFTMRHARFGKSGQMVLYALLGGFLIFFLRSFAEVLGENGQIPIVVAAWSPPVAAVLLALSLLLHLEDG